MLVYRVEHKTEKSLTNPNVNTGFYRTSSRHIISQDVSRHPVPQEDGKLCDIWYDIDNTSDYVFGFDSMNSLRRWFYKPQELKDEELRIGVYSVSEEYVHEGYTQLIFLPEHARLVRTLHVTADEDSAENQLDTYSEQEPSLSELFYVDDEDIEMDSEPDTPVAVQLLEDPIGNASITVRPGTWIVTGVDRASDPDLSIGYRIDPDKPYFVDVHSRVLPNADVSSDSSLRSPQIVTEETTNQSVRHYGRFGVHARAALNIPKPWGDV